jgi:hypothetical protein
MAWHLLEGCLQGAEIAVSVQYCGGSDAENTADKTVPYRRIDPDAAFEAASDIPSDRT